MKNLWSGVLANGKRTTVLMANDLKELSEHLGAYGGNVLWVFDTNTSNMFKQMPANRVVIESGEIHKNLNSLLRIISTAAECGMARDSIFIGFGGGVVCDMTSFASSLYMRGTRLTLVPTTLLCMCDACLGGKAAIDFNGQKNLLGSFYPAQEVLVCSDTLRTLSDAEYINGLGEVIKHAILSPDDQLYKLLVSRRSEILKRDKSVMEEMIALSLQVKAHYLEQDPDETKGIRQMLNLGHTFGHALESSSRFTRFSHGQCVAWGTCRAFEAGVALGLSDPSYAQGALKLFKSFGYEIEYRIGRGDWIEFISHIALDKKKLGGKVMFVIPLSQGNCKLMPLDQSLIQKLVIAHY